MTRQVQVIEMKHLRRISVTARWHRVRNEVCDVTGVTRWLAKRTRFQNEHITRMDHIRLVKITGDNKAISKRKVKIPRMRWRQIPQNSNGIRGGDNSYQEE